MINRQFVSSVLVSGLLVVAASIAAPRSAEATSLTFDIFTDAAKTTLVANSSFIPQTYGDNVTDFDPAGPIGGKYYRYGSDAGFTPDVKVESGWFLISNPGSSSGIDYLAFWPTDYQGLTNVVFPGAGSLWYNYVAFSNGVGPVKLHSFDVSKYNPGSQGGLTIKIQTNPFAASPTTLWSAGPDGGVTIGARTNYFPGIDVGPGETIYLIFGTSGNMGLDNVVFSQTPEPSCLLLAGLGVAGLALRRSRR